MVLIQAQHKSYQINEYSQKKQFVGMCIMICVYFPLYISYILNVSFAAPMNVHVWLKFLTDVPKQRLAQLPLKHQRLLRKPWVRYRVYSIKHVQSFLYLFLLWLCQNS